MSFSLSGQSLDDGSVSGTISYDRYSPFSARAPILLSFTGQPPLPWGSGSYDVQSGGCFTPHSPSAQVGSIVNTTLDFTVAGTTVPEPSANFLLLGVGLAGLSGFAWWRRRN